LLTTDDCQGNLYYYLLAKSPALCLQFRHHRFTFGEVASL